MRDEVRFFPTKDLFIDTITKDINIADCIFDLIDNAVDSFVRNRISTRREIRVDFKEGRFWIFDTCGGISLKRFTQEVFRLGFPTSGQKTSTIGMYGIGLKRSIFKLGRNFTVETDDGKHYARLDVDVIEWRKDDSWDVPLTRYSRSKLKGREMPYTKIQVWHLYDDVANTMTNRFWNQLIEKARKYYTYFLEKSIDIYIRKQKLLPFEIVVNTPKDFKPASYKERFDSIDLRIICWVEYEEGRAKFPLGRTGWNIFMNNRLIIHDDVSPATGWSGEPSKLPRYHQLYNQFRGVVYITSADPSKLPINTEKNGFNTESAAYIHILNKMVEVARPIKNYLSKKYRAPMADSEELENEILDFTESQFEETQKIRIERIPAISKFIYPERQRAPKTPTETTIQYYRATAQVDKLKRYFRVKSNKRVGEETFDYAYRTILGENEND